MTNVFNRRITAVFSGLLMLLCVALPGVAAVYTVGQKVEVREGDTWSPAIVNALDGPKCQIRYDGDTTLEWVTGDRIRLPGGAAPNAVDPKSTDAKPSGAKPDDKKPDDKKSSDKPKTDPVPKYGGFKVGDSIESKWGGMWRQAKVIKQTNGWTMVSYDNNQNDLEWVEPWRLRAVGTTGDDKTPYASPHSGGVRKNTPAPTLAPQTLDTGDKDAGNKPGDDKTTGAPAVPARADAVPLTQPNKSANRILQPTAVEEPASIDNAISATAPKMVSLHHGTPAFGVRTRIIANPQGKYALLGFTPNSKDEPTSIQRVELAGADAGSVVALSARGDPLAISVDGKRMLARAERSDRENMGRLDLWSIESSSPRALLGFNPYDDGTGHPGPVMQAEFVDATHFVTISGGQRVALWEYTDTSVKEIYSLQSDGGIFPQISPGGKFVTAGFGGKIVVLNILSGKCVACCAGLPHINALTTSLRSDVKKLALVGERRLVLIDLQDGNVLTDVGLPDELHGLAVAWLGTGLLLIDHHLIFDVDHQAVLWDYTRLGMPDNGVLAGDHYWYLTQSSGGAEGNGRSFLTSLGLPEPKAQAAEAHVAQGIFLVQPGTKISLEVNIDSSGDDRQKVIDHFTQQLTANGVTIEDGQPLKLVVETKSGHSETKTFSDGSKNHPSETVTATQTIYRVAFESDGKELWADSSASGGYLPNMVWLQKDQTVSDALSYANKPQISFFMGLDLPKTILKPTDPVGTSSLTGMAGGGAAGRPRVKKP